MKATLFFLGLTLTLALLATGCARPPTDEMNSAVEAVTRAENDSDVVLYAPATLARAREALRIMHEEAASRRFDGARAYAAEAIAAAERAIAEGRAGAQRAREEAAALIAGLPPLLAETGRGIESARDAGLDLDFAALHNDFEGAAGAADSAVAAYSAGLYADAIDSGRAARNGLDGINRRIAGAALAVPSGK